MPVCFWEDLVNTEQEDCDGGGGYVLSRAGTSSNCGGSEGYFSLPLVAVAPDYTDSLIAALLTAVEITLTGVYQDDILVDDFINAVDDPIPEYVVFTAVNYPMTEHDFEWKTADVTELNALYGCWFRFDIDGTVFYGASGLATPC